MNKPINHRKKYCGLISYARFSYALLIGYLLIFSGLAIADRASADSVGIEQNIQDVVKSGPETISIEQAKELFQTRCTACHNQDGKGNREVAPNAPDFTDVTWQLVRSDDDLIEAIDHGIGSGKGAMPKWHDLLSPAEFKALAGYIRTFAKSSKLSREQEIAKSLYQINCAVCHDKNGKGKKHKYATIPDFTDAGWQREKSNEEMIDTIIYGRSDKGMPKWKDLISEDEARTLVDYIRTFKSKKE